MENQLIYLQNLFERRRDKFPNLVKFWEKYIDIQKKRFQHNLDKCEELFTNIENDIQQDIPMETIIFLAMLSRIKS